MSRQFSLVLKVTQFRLNASLLMALAFLCVLAFSHSADKTSKTGEHGKEVQAYGRPHWPRFVADMARELFRLYREPAPVHGSDEPQEGIPMIRRFRVSQFA